MRTFEDVSRVTIFYKIENRRFGDIAMCYANYNGVSVELGVRAKLRINEMCKNSWHWKK